MRSPRRRAAAVILSLLASLAPFTARAADEPTVDPKDLPRVKPLEVPEAIKAFKLRKGLRIEPVATEPEICSPICIAFDEDQRLFVVEMRDYPDLREQKLGRIKVLESTKGDGHYDKATVYAEELPWPTGVICWDGGIFVCASPDILYFKDTKHDGVADVKKLVFTGFGNKLERLNVQGLVNGLTWGMDGRIYGTSGENGGVVGRPETPEQTLDLRGKHFSFDPRKLDLRAKAGGGQYGIAFDDGGREFTCSNAHHAQTFAYDIRYAARNPGFAMPPSLVDIAVDGPAAEVFRISPEEAWRVVRTQWRKAGKVKGPVEGGGRASGYFTSASGITIYRGDALPAEFRGNLFVTEPANNLMHRKLVRPDAYGTGVVAERPADERGVEFLASPDIFCRPVMAANGPDGALYMVDMYRECIEHPWSLPENIKQYLDLHSGADRGRVWRIVPENWQRPAARKLSKATTAELVELLASPNGWTRDTASRLLCERRDPDCVAMLGKTLTESPSAVARLHALHLLAYADVLTDEQRHAAAGDADATVREHVIKLSEAFIASPDFPDGGWQAIDGLAQDPSASVRLQLAFSLGASRDAKKVGPLLAIASRDGANPLARAAIINSLAGFEAEALRTAANDADLRQTEGGGQLLRQLATLIGARNKADEVAVVTELIAAGSQSNDTLPLAMAGARALREGQRRAGAKPADVGELIGRAKSIAADEKAEEAVRVEAIGLLGTTTFAEAGKSLTALLEPRQAQGVQSAAIAALGRFTEPDVAAALVKRIGQLSPRLRSEAIAVLIARPERAMALLNGIAHGDVRASELASTQATFLRHHKDARVAALAAKVLGPAPAARDDVIKAFQPALQLTGDAVKGKLVYEQRCISCHRLAGEGSPVGPDLTTVRAGGKEKMLINILDPNREVAPNYLAYVVETKGGDSLTGIIVNETGGSLTVRQPFGKETVVLRSEVKRIEGQKLSLMPEGLEAGWTPQDLADLLEFVSTAKGE